MGHVRLFFRSWALCCSKNHLLAETLQSSLSLIGGISTNCDCRNAFQHQMRGLQGDTRRWRQPVRGARHGDDFYLLQMHQATHSWLELRCCVCRVQEPAAGAADTASTAGKRNRCIGRCCQQRGSPTHPGVSFRLNKTGPCSASLQACPNQNGDFEREAEKSGVKLGKKNIMFMFVRACVWARIGRTHAHHPRR